MKQTRKPLAASLCLVLCLLLSLSSCIQLEEPRPGTASGTHHYLTMIYSYTVPVDEGLLTTGLDPAYLTLANKTTVLGEGYVPASLVNLTCPTYLDKEIQLNAKAASALDAMLAELRAAGVTDLLVTSAYRSYAYQSSLFNHYLQKEQEGISQDAYNALGETYIQANYTALGLTRLSAQDAKRVVLSYSAQPGTSEHQTGLCVDFITPHMNGHLTTAFEDTAAFAWLRENAYRFGFILRYPKGKEDVTGYTYEPWHYRFVGREAATDMYVEGITLEEYLSA